MSFVFDLDKTLAFSGYGFVVVCVTDRHGDEARPSAVISREHGISEEINIRDML